MAEKEHIYYFDYLRIVAFISVIFMHAASMPLRYGINKNWYVTNFFTCLAFTAVPFFMMMSGYLLMSSEKTTDVSSLFKRLPRLVLPLIFWSLVAVMWILYAQDNLNLKSIVSAAIGAIHQPVMLHLWYMYTLIAIYVISPFLYAGLHGLKRSGHILLFSLIVLVNVQYMLHIIIPVPFNKLFEWDVLYKMQIFGGHLCTFFLGYYLGTCKKRVSNRLLLMLSAICLCVITVGTWYLTVHNGEFDQTFQVQSEGFEVLLASCLFLYAKQNFNKTCSLLNRFVKPLAVLSLPIYLIHNIILSIFGHYGLEYTTFAGIVFTTFLVVIIAYLITKTIASFKPLCFIANGINYSSACNSANWQYTYKYIKNILQRKSTTKELDKE